MMKVVKVVEPMNPLLNPAQQAVEMARKARARAEREGTPFNRPKVLIVVEQEFDDGK